jgi:hypothetical protein
VASECNDRWVLRTSLIREIDAVLAAVGDLLERRVPERALEVISKANESFSDDSR